MPGIKPRTAMARVRGPDSWGTKIACQPGPCRSWIFSSSVISLMTMSARASGERLLSDQG